MFLTHSHKGDGEMKTAVKWKKSCEFSVEVVQGDLIA